MKLLTILSQTPLQLSRVEMDRDEFKTKRLLSISQPELDTSDAFDIPSPPPVATNRFESGFSRPSASFDPHAGAQEPLKGCDPADVPDEAPKAPIATIPELQICPAASSEESISAHDNAPQSGLTPAAPAHTENQTMGPADRPQVDLHPSEGAVSESAALTIVPQNDLHQRSAPTETSVGAASVRGKTSHDQLETPDAGGSLVGGPHTAGDASTLDAAVVLEPLHQAVPSRPEAASASAPAEISAPEAVPPSAVSHKKSPRLVNQDEVYGALYDSLFPQSFTSEVLSSLSTPPPQIFIKDQQSKTIVRTVDEYRTETSTPPYPGQSARSAAGRDDPIHPYAGSRFTSYQREPEPELFKGTDIHSRAANCLSAGPLLHPHLREDTPSTVLQITAPPVSDFGTAPGRDARVTESVPALTRVRHVVRDQVSSQAVSPSNAPENKPGRNPEWKTQTPAPPGDMEGFLSPTYLSVGSDDGSVMDIYYSAEEDNTESGDDEMYAMDEGGAQMDDGVTTVGLHKELAQQGDFSARGVSDRDEGKFRGILVLKSIEERKEDGQARGHGSEAHLQDKEKFLKVMAQVEEEETEPRGEKLLAKPVLQGNRLAVCDFVPPSAEQHGRLEDCQQIWAKKLETEEPPNGEQRSLRQPLEYLSRKNGPSYDARQEVIITAKSATTEKQVSIVAEAEKSSEDGRHTDGRCAASAAADTAALLTGSLTHRGSAAEHNRVPQSAEWVDTITRSAGRSGNLEPEVQLHLTDTQRTAAAPPSGSPEHPAEAQPDPSQG